MNVNPSAVTLPKEYKEYRDMEPFEIGRLKNYRAELIKHRSGQYRQCAHRADVS